MLHVLLALLRPVFASPEAEATVRQPRRRVVHRPSVFDQDRTMALVVTDMPQPRVACRACICGGQVMVIGGHDGDDDHRSVIVYNEGRTAGRRGHN